MKLKRLKGLAHDLAWNLSDEMWFGDYKNLPKEVDRDVLQQRSKLDKMCVSFFKYRLPKSFDFNRIKEIRLKIHRTKTAHKIMINIKVDNTGFSYSCWSSMVR